MTPYSHYNKIKKCIESCETAEQLDSCAGMILRFRNNFSDYHSNASAIIAWTHLRTLEREQNKKIKENKF